MSTDIVDGKGVPRNVKDMSDLLLSVGLPADASGAATLVGLAKGLLAITGTAGDAAGLATLIGQLKSQTAALGLPADLLSVSSVIGLLKAVVSANGAVGDAAGATSQIGQLKSQTLSLGSPTDAAWDGASANPSLIAIMKRVGALLGSTDPAAIVGLAKVAVATLVRPADAAAYAVGDLIANSTTAGSVTPLTLDVARVNGGTGNVRRIRLSTSNTTTAGAIIRVHLFRNAPATTVGDNGVFSGAIAGVAAIYLGAFDVTLDSTFSDGAKGVGVPRMGGEVTFDTKADVAGTGGSTLIYALLEARSVFTPASGDTFVVAAEVFRD